MASLQDYYKNLPITSEEEEKIISDASKEPKTNSLESYYNNLKTEQEPTQEAKESTTNTNLNAIDIGTDILVSGTQGAAKGVTYLADIPSLLGNGMEYLTDKAAAAVGIDAKQIRSENKNIYAILDSMPFSMGSLKQTKGAGQSVRENILKYKPKTRAGEYSETIGEFAAPGAIFGKGARLAYAATGAIGGATKEVTESNLGEGGSLAAGVGVNLALDLFLAARGNVANLVKDVLPSEKIIEKARKLQKTSKAGGMTLTAGEATGSRAVQNLEGEVLSSTLGAKLQAEFYETRPEQLKNFILRFAKSNGLITNTARVSNTKTLKALQNAAIFMQGKRQRQWESVGGLKFNKSFVNQVDLDNVINRFSLLEKSNKVDKNTSKAILMYIDMLKKSEGNGANLHNVYKQIRDTGMDLATATNKTALSNSTARVYKELGDDLNKLLEKQPGFKTAQTKYKEITNQFFKPIEKTKLFKGDLRNAKWTDDYETVGKLYKLFGSDKLSQSDIRKLAKSFKFTEDKKSWRKIMSGYVDNLFQKSQVDTLSDGLNIGTVFNKALTGSPSAKSNLSEMLYQLSLESGFKGTKTDIAKAIDNFSDVLKASGQYAKVGSQTAGKLTTKETLETGKFQILSKLGIGAIDDWFKRRTYSKNAGIISEALLSNKGIEELISLAKNWKDPAAGVAFVRAITLGSSDLND